MKNISTYLLLGCLALGSFACGQATVSEESNKMLAEEAAQDSSTPVEAAAPVVTHSATTEETTPTPIGPISPPSTLAEFSQPLTVDALSDSVLEEASQPPALPAVQVAPSPLNPSDVLDLL